MGMLAAVGAMPARGPGIERRDGARAGGEWTPLAGRPLTPALSPGYGGEGVGSPAYLSTFPVFEH
jgi:hypothetical protein